MALVHPSTRHFLEYLTAPAPPGTVLGYISSGPQQGTAAPIVIGSVTAGFAFTGNSGFGGSVSLPLQVTAPLPSGILPGDVIVAKVSLQGVKPGVGATIFDLSPTAGWVEDQFIQQAKAVYLLHHLVTGGELPTVTFSYPGPQTNFSGFTINVLLTAIRGANTSTPLDNVAFNGPTNPFTSATAPSIATSLPNELILIYLEPSGNGFGGVGPGHITNAGNIPGTDLQINFQSPNGTLEDSCYEWTTSFVGPGTAGPFTSPSGWERLASYQATTIAILPGPVSGSIQGFPAGANGAIVPFPVIVGPTTQLIAPQGLWIDSGGVLWAADTKSNTNGAILAFGHPSTSGANTAPDISIHGGTSTVLNPFDVVTDLSGNIYVANNGHDDILIFASGSNGNVAPTLTIAGNLTLLSKPRAVAVASNGDVFAINDTVNAIYCWTAGHTGNRAPDRTITGAATLLNNPLAMRFDSDGHLWVTNAGYLLEFLETDNGNVAPQTQVINAGLESGFDLGIGFDVQNNAYVSELLSPSVIEFQNDSSTGIPLAVITGWLSGPWGIAINLLVTPPSVITCIPIEWQTPGRMLDEGRVANCSRFFLDLNTNQELLSVTILVDDQEFNYPIPIQTNGRETVEIAWQVSGRIYSIRLSGCLTIGQIELYECWSDVHEGDEQVEAAG